MPNDIEARTMRKVALRIVPFIMLLYFIAYIDREDDKVYLLSRVAGVEAIIGSGVSITYGDTKTLKLVKSGDKWLIRSERAGT